MTMSTWVYGFGAGRADGTAKMRDLLGGKGANLAEMCSLGLPVPPGFTITTEVCRFYYDHDRRYPKELAEEVRTALRHVEETADARLGDPERPLLVSVRSGAPVSMPGMMDTVLNLGLNDRTVEGLAKSTGDPRFAYDSYRRFIQMYGDVVLGVDHYLFEDRLDEVKRQHGYDLDTELGADDLRSLVEAYQKIVEKQHGAAFPQDVEEQLWGAIGAVFGSWMTPRAVTYRRLHDIDNAMGTAVNVQAMVFGNRGERSATGVAFTRDPSTGEKRYYGEFLVNAQGEDVVAGIRTPQPLTIAMKEATGGSLPAMEEVMPDAFAELATVFDRLEAHYRDMQDIEFTVQDGRLWILQTRSGKRTTHAALKIAVDMAEEGLIDRDQAVARIDPASLDQLLHPMLDPDAPKKVVAKGLPASPGRRLGQGGVQRRRRRAHGCRRRGGAARARRDVARGHPRHACGQGHPDLARRHDQPRRGGRARHGQAVRVRRGRAGDRLSPRPAQHRHDPGRRRRGAHDRRQPRRGHPRRRADRRPQTLGRFCHA